MPKMNKSKKAKEENKKFQKKHINHDPQSESSRAAFDEPKAH